MIKIHRHEAHIFTVILLLLSWEKCIDKYNQQVLSKMHVIVN